MSGNQKRLMRVQFAMVGVSLLMNITLIPVFGVIGAALAAATVNVSSNLWNLMQVRQALQISPYNRSYFALAIPATLDVATVALVRVWAASMAHPWLGILAALAGSYLVFCAVALKFSLDVDDKMIAMSAWGQLRGSLQRR
jgi:O-antigen/teichoic acid export membrane protein